MKKAFYSLDIKNPYLHKGNFLWKHNSDEDLGKHHECEYKEEGTMLRSNKGWMGHEAKRKTYKCSKCGRKLIK